MTLIDFFASVIKPRKLRGTGCLHPQETGWVADEVAAIRCLDVNIWLIKSQNGFVAFDSGYVAAVPEMRAKMHALGIDPMRVQAVFLTHADLDHAGGVAAEDQLFPKATVFAHRAELDMLAGREFRFRFGPIKLRNPINYPGLCQFFASGDTFDWGGLHIEAIHVPGHTPGHSVYLVNESILVSGDCLAFNENGGYGFFDLFNLDTQQNLSSIRELEQRLAGVPLQAVLSGHSGIYRGNRVFAQIDQVAKGTRKVPFDPAAPIDVFS